MSIDMIVVSCLIGVLIGMQIAVARAVFELERRMRGVTTASELTLSAVNRIDRELNSSSVAKEIEIPWPTYLDMQGKEGK